MRDGLISKLVIFGSGGHARDVHSVLVAAESSGVLMGGLIDLLGFVSNEPDEELLGRLGSIWLGDDGVLEELEPGTRFLIGVGSGALRRALDSKAQARGLVPLTLIHPTASVGPDVQIGGGCVLFANTSVTTNVRLGGHTHLNAGSSVSHDCVLGDYVTLNPGARVCGWVTLGDEVMVGANAAVNERLVIGDRAAVGSGAAVTQDVPPGATAVGVPARFHH